MKKYLIILLATAALFSSCKKEDPAKITLSKETVTLSSSDTQASFSFTTNYEWTAKSDASWLTLENASGVAGSSTLSAKISEPELNDRVANVVIFCRDVNDTIKVTQKQKDQILLTSKERTCSAEGETFSVSFGTNVAYQVVIPSGVNWIKTVDLKAYQTKEVSFVVDANDSYDERKVEIVFKSNTSNVSDTFVVTQVAKNGLIVDPSEINIDNTAQTVVSELLYNVDYEIAINAPGGWLKLVREPSVKGLKSEKYTFSVSENNAKTARTATITFKSPKTGLSQKLTINQSGVPCRTLVFEINAKFYKVPAIEGEDVEGTIDWGDGYTSPYTSSMFHTYKAMGTYTVTISTYYSNKFTFTNTADLQEIDLSKF